MAAGRPERQLRDPPSRPARAARAGDDHAPRRGLSLRGGRGWKPDHLAHRGAPGEAAARRSHRSGALPPRASSASRRLRRRFQRRARGAARREHRARRAHLPAHPGISRPHQALGRVAVGVRGAGPLPAAPRRARARPPVVQGRAKRDLRGSILESGGAHARAPARGAQVLGMPRGRLRACEGPRVPRVPCAHRPARGAGDVSRGALRGRTVRHVPPRAQGREEHASRRRPLLRGLPPGPEVACEGLERCKRERLRARPSGFPPVAAVGVGRAPRAPGRGCDRRVVEPQVPARAAPRRERRALAGAGTHEARMPQLPRARRRAQGIPAGLDAAALPGVPHAAIRARGHDARGPARQARRGTRRDRGVLREPGSPGRARQLPEGLRRSRRGPASARGRARARRARERAAPGALQGAQGRGGDVRGARVQDVP